MLRVHSLQLSAAILLAVSLTYSPTQAQCTGRPRCRDPPPSNSSTGQWISNITVTEYATSARLEWIPVATPNNARYIIIFRNVTEREMRFTQTQPIRATSFDLDNSVPDTRYELLVCRQSFNFSTVPRPPNDPRIPDCGFCSICFETDEQNFMFETTLVSRMNDTYINLTCQVKSNANFEIFWTFVSLESGSSRRRRLGEGDLIDGDRVSIDDTTLQDVNGVGVTVTSSLTAPDTVLEQSVECLAESEFESRRSMMGAFEEAFEEEPISTDPSPSKTILIPVWAIVLLVVLPLLITILVVMVRVVVYIVHRRRKRVKYKEATELRQLSMSNDYLESSPGRGKDTQSDYKLFALEDSTLSLAIPEEMIIDNSLLSVSTVVGQGEFGVVYKGQLRRGSISDTVAVKSLKGIFVNENDVQSALKEISKMKNFDHPNVMTLVGVCKATAMSGGAPSIVMPFMARGSLLNYLRNDRESLVPAADSDITQTGAVQKLLMQICLQISKGMVYLASLRFVHRDLAARNCMIDEKGIIKVADFGLAEDIYMRNYFRQSSQDTAVKLPLKWMAPESIKLGIFSEKSDVWSYGVTCWEVFTAGEIPYPGIHPREVVQLLEDGEHLSKPKNKALSDTMFGFMRSCWSYRSENRPDFEELASSLDKELTTLADYVDLSMFADESNVNTASVE